MSTQVLNDVSKISVAVLMCALSSNNNDKSVWSETVYRTKKSMISMADHENFHNGWTAVRDVLGSTSYFSWLSDQRASEPWLVGCLNGTVGGWLPLPDILAVLTHLSEGQFNDAILVDVLRSLRM